VDHREACPQDVGQAGMRELRLSERRMVQAARKQDSEALGHGMCADIHIL